MTAALKSIYTIGHSTRSIEEFIALLKAHAIELVIDVRTIPMSRHCPQFNQEKLKKALEKSGIKYQHRKDLGGLRHTSKDSINTGWINASFRGYADYMQTSDFQNALEKLEKVAQKKRSALMCAEAVPWRCHRSLVADALTVRKWKVFHIQSQKTAKRHKRTSFLRIKKRMLTYPS
jgi:uncharacterized protein (DUF488 family)